MKKIKIVLSSILTMLIAFLLSFSLTEGEGPKKADAASATVLDVNYAVYDENGLNAFQQEPYWKQDIEKYINYIVNDNDALAEMSISKKNFISSKEFTIEQMKLVENYGVWSDSGTVTASGDSSKSLEEYWGGQIYSLISNPITWNTSGSSKNPQIDTYTNYGRTFNSSPITKASPGDTIYLGVLVTSPGAIDIHVGVNFTQWINGGGEFINNTPLGANFGSVKSDTSGAQNLTNNATNVGFTLAIGTTFSNSLIGYFTLKVGDSMSGSYTFDLLRTGYSSWTSSDESLSVNGDDSQNWKATPTTITVGGSQSTTTTMGAPKVSTASLSQTTLTSNDSFKNSTLPTGTTLGKTDTYANLYLDPLDNASIAEVRYSYSSTSSAETGTLVSASGAGYYQIPTERANVSLGGSVYVAVKVQSQDKKNTDWKYITLTRASASSTTNISNVTVGGNSASLRDGVYSTSSALSETTTTTDVAFTLDDNAQVKNNQTYLFNSLADAKAAGSSGSYTSGTALNYTGSKTTINGLTAGDEKYLLIPLEAENGGSGYQIIKVSVAASSNSSVTSILYNSQTYALSNGSVTINVSAVLTSVSFSVNYTGKSVTIGSDTQSGNPATFNGKSLNPTGNTTFTITPTAPNGTNGASVSVIFHKLSNDADPTIKIETFTQGSSAANTTETISSWTSSGTASNATTIPYASKTYIVTITNLPSGASILSNSAGTTIVGNNSYTAIAFNNVKTATTATVEIKIQSEDKAQHTYTLTLNREAASSSTELSNVKVAGKNTSTSNLPADVDYTGTANSYSDTRVSVAFDAPTNGKILGVYQHTTAATAKNSPASGTKLSLSSGVYTATGLTSGSKAYVAIQVEAEDGTTTVKVIEITVPQDSTSEITSVGGNTLNGSTTVTIPYSSGNSVTFAVVFRGSKVVINGKTNEITTSGDTFTVDPAKYGTTITLIPYANDGTTAGTAITVKFVAQSTSTKPTVILREFDNNQVNKTITDWDSNNSYEHRVPYGTTQFNFSLDSLSDSGTAKSYNITSVSAIGAVPASGTLVIKRNHGPYAIATTPVTDYKVQIILVVAAQDGTEITYTINLIREAASSATTPVVPNGASQSPDPSVPAGSTYKKIYHIVMPPTSATQAVTSLNGIEADPLSSLASSSVNAYKSLTDAINGTNAITNYTISNKSISSVTLGNPGESVFIAVPFEAQDGTTKTLIIYELPRSQSDSAYLNGIVFIANGTTSTSAALSPNFSPNTTSYDLILPKGTQSVDVTATLDTLMKGQLTPNGGIATLLTSGTALTNVSISGVITVTIIPQSGDTSKARSYTFTPVFKSNDVSVKSVVVNYYDANGNKLNTTAVNATYDSSTKEYSVTVPYAAKKFDFEVVTNDVNAKVKYSGQFLTGPTGSISINNATPVTDATKNTEQFDVIAEDGVTSSPYYVVVNRKAADTTNTISTAYTTVDLKDEKGVYTPINGNSSANGSTIVWTATAKVPYTSDSIRVRFKVDSLLSTVKVNGVLVAIGQNGDVEGADMTFSGTAQCTLTYIVEVISESGVAQKYEFNVTREAADNDKTYTLDFDYVDENGAPQKTTTAPNAANPLAYSIKLINWKITATKATTTITVKSITASGLSGNLYSGSTTNISGQSQPLSLSSTSTTGNYIIYTITVEIKSQDQTVSTELINIYVTKPNSANTVSTWDLIVQSTGNVKAPNTTVANTKTYELTQTETFTLDIRVSGDPNGLTKIYYSKTPVTASSVNDYINSCTLYDSTAVFNPGDNVYVYLIPENGNVKSYVFETKTSVPKQSNADIDNVEILEITTSPNSLGTLKNFVWNSTTANLGTYTVSSNCSLIHVRVTPAQNSDKASINAALTVKQINTDYAISLSEGQNVIKFQLIAQNGDLGTEYTIIVERPIAETYDKLTNINIGGVDVPKNNNGEYDSIIDVLVPRNTANATINAINVIDGNNIHAKYEIYDGTSKIAEGIGKNKAGVTTNINNLTSGIVRTLEIRVYSEQVQNAGGSPNIYKLNLYPASTDYSVKNININDINGNDVLDINNNGFNFNGGSFASPFVVNYSTKYAELVVTGKNQSYATITINGTVRTNCIISNLVVGQGMRSNMFNVTVESEFRTLLKATNPASTLADDQIETYNIQIDRNNGSSDATLKSIVVTNNGNQLPFDQDTPFTPSDPSKINYAISGPTVSSNSVTITVEPTDPKAKLGSGWIAKVDGTYSKTFNIPNTFAQNGGNDQLTIDVFSEIEMGNTNPTALTYSVIISSVQVKLDTDHTITLISAYYADGTQNKYLLGSASSNPEKEFVSNPGNIYEFTVPASVNSIDLSVLFPKKATLLVNNTAAGASGIYNGTVNLKDDTTTIKIKCNAESNTATDTEDYTIIIKTKALDTDTSLDSWDVTDPSATNPNNAILNLLDAALAGQTLYLDSSYAGQTLNVNASVSAPKTINTTGKTTLTLPQVFNSGSNLLTITVKSETPGTEKIYTVNVVVKANLDLASIIITDSQNNSLFNDYDPITGVFSPIADPLAYVNGNSGANISKIWVANDVSVINYMATLKDLNASFANNSVVTDIIQTGTLATGSLTAYALRLTIIVQDQSGATKQYIIDVYRVPGETSKNIESYVEEGQTSPSQTFNPNASTYEYRVDNSVTAFEAYKYWTLSNGATYKLYDSKGGNNYVLAFGKNEFTVEVYSENEPTSNPHIYTITVWRANNDYEITNIEFLESLTGSTIKQDSAKPQYVFNSQTLTYDIYVPYSVDKTYLKVTLSDLVNAGWKLNGNISSNGFQVISVGDNTFTITGVSQYGLLNPNDTNTKTSETYNIVIHRAEPSSDATLKDLQAVVYDSVIGKYYDYITGQYLDRNPGDLPDPLITVNSSYIVSQADKAISDPNVSDIQIFAVANDPNAKIISGTGTYSFLNGSVSGQVAWIYNVVVQAENGDQKTYTITLSKEVANPDKDNSISNISVVAKGVEYIPSFNPTTQKYQITIPYGPDSYTLSATTALGSSAKLYIDQITNPQIQRTSVTKTLSLSDGGTTVTYYVQAEALDATIGRGKEYEIEISFEKADSDSSIKEIKVDGALVPNFNSNDLTYNLSYPYTTDSITITGVPNSSKSIIDAAGLGKIDLVPGQITQHTITCRAEDGSTTTYILNIYRDSENPYFSNLKVPGYDLLDKTTLKPTEYDKTAPGYDASGAPIEVEYHVVVPNSQATGSISIEVPDAKYVTTISQTGESITTGISRTFNNLAFNIAADGSQADTEFIINGTSPSGKIVKYKVIVTRLGIKSADTSFNISKIDAFDKVNGEGSKVTGVSTDNFKTDFAYGRVNYEYTVPNKVQSLDFAFAPAQPGAKVEVFGANKLISNAVNDVVVVVTAEDGMTTKAYVIKVTREAMAYEVVADNNGEDFTLVNRVENNGIISYDLKLKANALKKVADKEAFFKRYISYDKNNNAIDVEIINDLNASDLTSVTLKITDGTDENYIIINLENELDYEVITDGNGDNYKLSNLQDNGKIKSYDLKLDSKGLKKVEDKEEFFKNYIKADNSNVTVEIVSDLSSDDIKSVTLKVTDGVEEEFVVINVNVSAGILDSVGGYFFLGGIIICALLLLAILVAVHKDKYGKVADKRKKA